MAAVDLLTMVSIECGRSIDVEKIAGMLLAGWGSFDTTQGGDRCVSNDEMRQALRTGGDAFRRQVLWHLKTWSKQDGNGWDPSQALVLLRDVWPRDRAVRTEETSEHLFDLAIDADRGIPIRQCTKSSAFVITYVPTMAGFLYLAVVLDAWSRK